MTKNIGFLTENKEKEDAKNAKDATLEGKKQGQKTKRKKENIRVDAMVKRWIKEMEKKVD